MSDVCCRPSYLNFKGNARCQEILCQIVTAERNCRACVRFMYREKAVLRTTSPMAVIQKFSIEGVVKPYLYDV
jgi:hypothetical protein